MKSTLVPLALGALLAGGLVATSSTPDAGGHGPQDFGVEASHVAGSVHVLMGRGGNVGASIGPDGVLLVDDQFEASVEPIREALAALEGGRVAYLVNTHWHGDHTGGNAALGRSEGGGPVIVAHRNVRARLAAEPGVEGRVNDPPAPPAALPVVTLENGLSLHVNGEEVRLLHFGGGAHTDGDTVVWFTGSNVVHMGDLYFDVGYPFLDLNSGGGAQGMVRALDAALEAIPADAKVIPGHGQVTGVAELRAYRDMVATVVERVREAMELGETPEQMTANGITQDFDERWGNFSFVPPARFVEFVHASLEAGR